MHLYLRGKNGKNYTSRTWIVCLFIFRPGSYKIMIVESVWQTDPSDPGFVSGCQQTFTNQSTFADTWIV